MIHPDIKLEMKPKSSDTTNPTITEMDNGNLENTRCTICGKDFATNSYYRRHVLRFHKDGRREPLLERNKMRISPNYIPIWDDYVANKRIMCRSISVSQYHRHVNIFRVRPLVDALTCSSGRD